MLNTKLKKGITSGLLFVFLFSSFSPVFATLNIKDDYCGVMINYKYCKCAFHGNQGDNKWCDKIGMIQETANEYVWNSFEAWKIELEKKCMLDNGFWVNEECRYPPKCSSREVAIDWNCHPISEFCGKDRVILYDVERKKCYCPEFYDLEREEGENKCVAQEEIVLEVGTVEGNAVPPLLADGENVTRFKIKGTYIETQSPVEFNFSLDQKNDRATGYISLERYDSKNGSIIFYGTPDLKWEEPGIFIDTLYLTYYSNLKKANETKRIKIVLYNKDADTMTISRVGFEDRVVPLLFEGKWMDVYAYTKAGSKYYPVIDAEIKYQESWKEKTDSEGMARLYNHRYTGGDVRKKVRVDMYLTPSLRNKRNQVQRYYDKIDVSNTTISNFLRNFAGYLAVEKDLDEIEHLSVLLKSLDYSLFFMSQGRKLSNDSTAILGDTLGMVIWDTFDFVTSIEFFNDKVKEVLKNWGLEKLDITPENIEDLQEKMVELRGFLDKWGGNALRLVWGKVLLVLSYNADTFSPEVIDNVFKELTEKYFSGKSSAKQQGLFDKLSIKSATKNALRSMDSKMYKTLLSKIADKLKRRAVVPGLLEEDMERSKANYKEFVDLYLDAHEVEYNISMFKAWTELTLDVGSSLAKIGVMVFAPQFFIQTKAVCDGIEKGYKGIKAVIIDSSQLVFWAIIYFQNRNMIIDNVVNVMRLNYAKTDPSTYLASVALASEEETGLDKESMELLQAIYDNNLTKDDPQREKAFEYLNNKLDLEFYQDLSQVISLTADLAPEDGELQSAKKELIAQVNQLEQDIKSGRKEIKSLKPIKKKGEGLIGSITGYLKEKTIKIKGIFSNKWTLVILGYNLFLLIVTVLGVVFKKKKTIIFGTLLFLIALSNLFVWCLQGSFRSSDYSDFDAGKNTSNFTDISSFEASDDIE